MIYRHMDCGGEIKNKKCNKCGKTWNLLNFYISPEVEEIDPSRFDPEAYRKRIREGKDIYKK